MSKKAVQAAANFRQGYNCAQSVALSFSEEIGMDKAQMLRMVSSFGGGMGRLREVCGAVSGMFFVAGALYGYDDPKDFQAKKEHYARIQELAAKFREKNGSIICRELLGIDGRDHSPVPSQRTEEYYKKRPCVEMIATAAQLMEEYIQEHLGTSTSNTN
ncbi:MAG: C_GCAxxG_C_C family protein [Eubacterium sp.]|nr:C_GCAxxG_C_C family protein [Eubacterium sp.]